MRRNSNSGRKQKRRQRWTIAPRVIVRDRIVTEIKHVAMDRDATVLSDTVNLVHYALDCMGITRYEQEMLWHIHSLALEERVAHGSAYAREQGIDFSRYASSFVHLSPEQFKAAMETAPA
jgi:hypothetical protein